MRYLPLFTLILFFAACGAGAVAPTTLRVVDLRGIAGQPELDTWMGSLQGMANRQDTETAVFVVRNGADAELATALIAMYGLRKETFTPGALLDAMKPSLTGQILYSPAQPWSRNIALTAAAVNGGSVLASDADLGLRTVLDLRGRWADRSAAYAWAIKEYAGAANSATCALAPESGHLLADLIVARKLLAIDLSPAEAAEKALLLEVLQRLPDGGQVLGSPDDRCGNADDALWVLTTLAGSRDRGIVPARYAGNLSCLSRFSVTRPLVQERYEAPASDGGNYLALVYCGGRALNGSQSLDYATQLLPGLLDDPALSGLAVGVEVPLALHAYAPALYQLLLARQRRGVAELLAAPNGEAWALPMTMADARPYVQRSRQAAAALDLAVQSFFDTGGKTAYVSYLNTLAAAGWFGAFAYPISSGSLIDKQPRQAFAAPSTTGQFTELVGTNVAHTIDDLRKAVAGLKGAFNVIYLDPTGLPPAELRAYLPEITANHTLMTPSQMLRTFAESNFLFPWMQEQQRRGIKRPVRESKALKVALPQAEIAAPTAGMAIPISVKITSATPILLARLIYTNPRGQVCAAELRLAADGLWKAVLPPTLVGGRQTIRARVVEARGMAVAFSDTLTLDIPGFDSDRDGLEDVAEAYRGTDAKNWDSDRDGLADGYDPDPTRLNRDIALLMPAIFPPADAPWLSAAGASTANEQGRTIPAGGSISYRLPLQDLPKAPAAVRLVTIGEGACALEGGATATLASLPEYQALTEIPVSALAMSGEALVVRVTAGNTPVTLASLTLTSNPNGPYILPVSLSPKNPSAGVPIFATATVYSTRKLKAVRLRYGTAIDKLAMLEMGRLDGTANAIFAETIPAQRDGTILLYAIEAEDVDGNIAATPFQATPIGRTRKTTYALLGTRDLQGAWKATPIWGNHGRASVKGTGADTVPLSVRPGRQSIWVLAQPIERAIEVKLFHAATLLTNNITLLKKTIPAGKAGGWYLVGSFEAKEPIDAELTISPVGESGYCAYGEVVVTFDDRFTPPPAHVSVDWYNTLTVTGLSNGDIVTKTIALRALPTGNLDAVRVMAKQLTSKNGVYIDDVEVKRQTDGSYALSTKTLPPGNYDVTATGYKLTKTEGGTVPVPVVRVTLHITVARE